IADVKDGKLTWGTHQAGGRKGSPKHAKAAKERAQVHAGASGQLRPNHAYLSINYSNGQPGVIELGMRQLKDFRNGQLLEHVVQRISDWQKATGEEKRAI